MFDRRHQVMLFILDLLDRSSFLADIEYHFFYQYWWIMFFGRGGLMFFYPSKWEHASVGRNTDSVELARKNKAGLHCKFCRRHRTTKPPLPKKKYYRPAFGNEIPQCRQKNISWGDLTTNVRCCLFLFNPPIIFGRCLLGNVRSASSGDSSVVDLDWSSSLADIDYHFVYKYRWIMIFCRGGPMFF